MNSRNGWKAIIYDAPWASFKRGQLGVIISDDGKTCDTIDDDKSRIIIVAEENPYFVERTGYALFKQKDSGLNDKVKFVQAAREHVYELHVQNVNMDGCTATYNGFKSLLNAYWIADGVREPATNYTIVTPKSSDFNNVSGGKTLQIKITASRDGKTYSATSTCIITRAADPVTSYTSTVISGLNGTTIPCCMSTKGTCTVLPSNSSVECVDGVVKKVNFSVTNNKNSWPKYTVSLTGVTAKDNFKITKCDGSTTTKTVDVPDSRITFSVTDGNTKVNNVSINGRTLTLNVKPGETFTIKVTVAATTETSSKTATTTINTANRHTQC